MKNAKIHRVYMRACMINGIPACEYVMWTKPLPETDDGLQFHYNMFWNERQLDDGDWIGEWE